MPYGKIFRQQRDTTDFRSYERRQPRRRGQGGFFEITEEGVEFVLRNFTFVNGSAETGGVVSCQACTLRVAENLFVRNVAEIWGDLIYMNRGQLSFYNNIVRENGQAGIGRGLVEIHNTIADTTKPDSIRNNTFHNINSPAITTSGARVDVSSNIFSTGAAPAIANPSKLDTPLVRYNMFWNWDLLYVSDNADSIKILKTVRDTLTLEEQGVSVPNFSTNEPNTVAQVGCSRVFTQPSCRVARWSFLGTSSRSPPIVSIARGLAG